MTDFDPFADLSDDELDSELNKSALAELADVDVIAFVIDASAPIGRGDAWVAERVAAAKAPKVLVLAKADLEREGQKGILVGKGGEMIKRIGIEARRDLERLFGCRVYLGLDVKVKPHWREDAREIRRFGYAADDE